MPYIESHEQPIISNDIDIPLDCLTSDAPYQHDLAPQPSQHILSNNAILEELDR